MEGGVISSYFLIGAPGRTAIKTEEGVSALQNLPPTVLPVAGTGSVVRPVVCAPPWTTPSASRGSMSSLFISLPWVAFIWLALLGEVGGARVQGPMRGSAALTCAITPRADIVSVTWQKRQLPGPVNVATYSHSYGVVVQTQYRHKANITCPGLWNSTLVIHNLAVDDEGCYLCIFNSFGGRQVSCTACLEVTSPPTGHVQVNSTEDADTVTCLATGRPPPNVTWAAPWNNASSTQEQFTDSDGLTVAWRTVRLPRGDNTNPSEGICLITWGNESISIPASIQGPLAHDLPAAQGTLAGVAITLVGLFGIFALHHCRRKQGGASPTSDDMDPLSTQ